MFAIITAETPNARIHVPADSTYMRDLLARVACNPLLDRPPIVPFNARLAPLGFAAQGSAPLLMRSASNAAIDRAGSICELIPVLDERNAHSAPVESLVRPPVDSIIQRSIRFSELRRTSLGSLVFAKRV